MKRLLTVVGACFIAAIATGCVTAAYTWNATITDPPDAEKMVFADDTIAIAFVVGNEGVSFLLKNRTAEEIQVNWDEVALVMPNGSSKRIIHEGVRLIARNEPQAPSVVPPYGQLIDSITPADNVGYLSAEGELITLEMFPATCGASTFDWEGMSFRIYFPLEMEGSRKEYQFTIQLDGRDVEKPKK